jgi:hypothetical protein
VSLLNVVHIWPSKLLQKSLLFQKFPSRFTVIQTPQNSAGGFSGLKDTSVIFWF